jgi:hypothetical protein
VFHAIFFADATFEYREPGDPVVAAAPQTNTEVPGACPFTPFSRHTRNFDLAPSSAGNSYTFTRLGVGVNFPRHHYLFFLKVDDEFK